MIGVVTGSILRRIRAPTADEREKIGLTILAQCRVAHSSIIRTDGSHRIGLVFVEIKGRGSDYLAQFMMEQRGIESPTADDYENL